MKYPETWRNTLMLEHRIAKVFLNAGANETGPRRKRGAHWERNCAGEVFTSLPRRRRTPVSLVAGDPDTRCRGHRDFRSRHTRFSATLESTEQRIRRAPHHHS